MEEIWVETGNVNNNNKTIVAVSNMGRVKTKDGEIRESHLREKLTYKGKRSGVHRFIALHFIPKTQEDIELGRNIIDHKTHSPIEMNVNDVRNLRWCTQKENNCFPEARENQRKAQLGSKHEPRSEFGKKFYEHYGLHFSDAIKLYYRELGYYKQHKKCSWEK